MYFSKPVSDSGTIEQIRSLLNIRKRLASSFQTHRNTLVHNSEGILQSDKKFVERSIAVIRQHLSSQEFNVKALSSLMNYNRSSLSKRIKKVVNKSPSEIILELRIIKATELLQSDTYNISEVAFACGFSSLSYFSQAFKKETGQNPTEWIESKIDEDIRQF
jgi:AraC-like DNA-binding protein